MQVVFSARGVCDLRRAWFEARRPAVRRILVRRSARLAPHHEGEGVRDERPAKSGQLNPATEAMEQEPSGRYPLAPCRAKSPCYTVRLAALPRKRDCA